MAEAEHRASCAGGSQFRFGAILAGGGVCFCVWAPEKRRVEVVLESADGMHEIHPLSPANDGTFAGFVAGVRAGQQYRYRVDGGGPYPDPASRFQPRGVHGPSRVVDPTAFAWSDATWSGLDRDGLVLYELHVGTFTSAGTFAAASERLRDLRELGVTAIELMPVADFAGNRNWGYDGVALFAPARCYGEPDELRALVDTAHGLGLGVILDVVYNHFGPDGAYHARFSEEYFSKRHRTPWGAAVNLDGEGSDVVRAFLVENALHWLREYHFDGLRLDATHALVDDGPRHFLAELSASVRASSAGNKKPPLLIAEDHRNLARLVEPEERGGYGLDAVWADDFHHQLRRALAGDAEGYFGDFSGSMRDLCATLRSGWFYRGQYSAHLGAPRGTDPGGLPPSRFVICTQNHDQIGNRAFGDRLHHVIEPAAWRAAEVLLLCAPEIPLLFMGQEWAATSPFLFFTDHEPGLGAKITCGRRREFSHFSAFRDASRREKIPDPQAEETFTASILRWAEREEPEHAAVLRLHRALLRLRREEPALRCDEWQGVDVDPVAERGLLLRRSPREGAPVAIAVHLRGEGRIDIGPPVESDNGGRWRALLDTEAPEFCLDPQAAQVELAGARASVCFSRPGALVLRWEQT